MAEQESIQQIRASLQEVSRILDEGHLDAVTRTALADLAKELDKTLNMGAAPTAEIAQLAGSVAQLARSLQQQEQPNLLAEARKRLEAAVLRAEAEHPTVTGIAWRLLDTLASLGI